MHSHPHTEREEWKHIYTSCRFVNLILLSTKLNTYCSLPNSTNLAFTKLNTYCSHQTLQLLLPANSTISAPTKLNNYCTHQIQQLLDPPNSTIIAPHHRNSQLCPDILVAGIFGDRTPGGTKMKPACMGRLAPAAVARNRPSRNLSNLVSRMTHVKAFVWSRKKIHTTFLYSTMCMARVTAGESLDDLA